MLAPAVVVGRQSIKVELNLDCPKFFSTFKISDIEHLIIEVTNYGKMKISVFPLLLVIVLAYEIKFRPSYGKVPISLTAILPTINSKSGDSKAIHYSQLSYCFKGIVSNIIIF